MLINIDRLNTFVVAADTLNFTQAARRLHLSQSAVSQQIRELEEELDVTLFERRGRGLALTPAAERLRKRALRVLREMNDTWREISAFQSVPQGVLRIGASNTLGIYLLPYALGRFSQQFPGVRTTLLVSEVDAIVRGLQEGELDLALIEQNLAPGRLHGWERVPLMEDEVTLIVPPEHPWAAEASIPLERLPESSFIWRQQNAETRSLIWDHLAEAGFDPERLPVRFELGNTEGIKRAVMAGLGVGWVSRHATLMERKAGLLKEVAVEGCTIRRTLWLLRPQHDRTVIHQQRFGEMLLGGEWLPEEMRREQSERGLPDDQPLA